LNKWLVAIAFSVLLLLPAMTQDAFAVLLSDLLAGENIVVGDKQFRNFRNFQTIANGPFARDANPAAVDVSPRFFAGEVGLEFSNPSFPTFSVGESSSQKSRFEFDVLVLDPNLRMSADTLQINGFFVDGPNSLFSIDEEVKDPLGNQLALQNIFVLGSGESKGPDRINFPPQSLISVNIVIDVIADTVPGSVARVNTFAVTFSQDEISVVTCGTGTTLNVITSECDPDVTQADLVSVKAQRDAILTTLFEFLRVFGVI